MLFILLTHSPRGSDCLLSLRTPMLERGKFNAFPGTRETWETCSRYAQFPIIFL